MRIKCAACGTHVPREIVLAVPLERDVAFFCSAACAEDAQRERRIEAAACRSLPDPPQRLVVAMDGSGPALRAVERAACLARLTGGRVEIVHAIGGRLRELGLSPAREDIAKSLEERAESQLHRARRICDDAGVPVETRVDANDPLTALLAAAERADLLLIGSQGLGAVEGGALGSLAARLVERARIPVLVVH